MKIQNLNENSNLTSSGRESLKAQFLDNIHLTQSEVFNLYEKINHLVIFARSLWTLMTLNITTMADGQKLDIVPAPLKVALEL